jgi:hypothetical protein
MLIREIFEDNEHTDNQKPQPGDNRRRIEVLQKRPFSTEKDIVIKPEVVDPWEHIPFKIQDKIYDYGWRMKHFMRLDGSVPEPEEILNNWNPPLA